MENLSKLLVTITKTCSDCEKSFEGVKGLSLTLCPECSHAAAQAELVGYQYRQGQRVDELVAERLVGIGLAKKERRAMLGNIPREIMRALPVDPVKALLEGKKPTSGFGLVGTQGAGKTMALAAIVKHGIADSVTSKINALDRVPYEGEEPWRCVGSHMLWISWPTVAGDLKSMVARDGGGDNVDRYIARAIIIPVLIIDDLGRERARGAYTEDYSIGQLDRIIDLRSREERPIIWTSNATVSDMQRFYGGAMMSRLVELAPPVPLPSMPDLRLGEQAAAG